MGWNALPMHHYNSIHVECDVECRVKWHIECHVECQVDNIDMSNITHEQAVEVLKSTSRQVRLVVAKCPPDSDFRTNGQLPVSMIII